MTSRSRIAVALAPFAVALLLSPRASADDYEAFWDKGKSLRADGKCTEAIFAFQKALELRPDKLGSRRNIAECEEQLGRFTAARSDWWSLRTAARGTKEPLYADWSQHAEDAYKRLESKVAKVTVRLSGPGVDRVQVTVDGQSFHPALVGTEVERDPGLHVFEASYGGAVPVRAERTLAAGAREVVTLVIPGEPATTGAPVDAGEKVAPGPSPVRTAGFVVLGAGVLGGVAMAGAAIVRANAQSALDQNCPNAKCPNMTDLTNGNSAESRGKTASTLLDVLIPLTVAGVGTGITLVTVGSIASPPSPRAPPSTASASGAEVVLIPSLDGARLRVGWRF